MNADRAESASAHDHSVSAHEQWDELAVGYAMSALEPDELERFVEHLVVKCPDCRQSVSDMRSLGAGFAQAVQPVEVPEPDAGLRSSVLAAAFAQRPAVPQDTAAIDDVAPVVSITASRPSATSAPPAPSHGAPSTQLVDEPVDAPVDELAVRRKRKLSERAGWLAAAAAAAVALVLAVTTTTAVHGRNQQSALTSDYSRALDAVARGGSATTVPLTDDSGHTVATVVARPHDVTVVTRGVKANAADNSYVLWGIQKHNGTPVALGDFDVGKGAVHSVQVAADARGAYSSMQTFGLSIEPGHTPPAKPSKILALGDR